MLAPDLKQNLFNTVYLLFTHNYIAFAYLIGLVTAAVLSVYRPSRFVTLILLGFLILLFSFEYDKHIIDSLRQQTLTSLITAQPHYRLEKIVNLIISEALPVIFYILGWFFIFFAIVYEALKPKKKNND